MPIAKGTKEPPKRKKQPETVSTNKEKITISKPQPPSEDEYWQTLESLGDMEPKAVVAFAQATGKTMAQLQQDIQFVKHSTIITGGGVVTMRDGQIV